MKSWLIAALIVSVAATAAPGTADAKRIGGGKSAGLQRNMPARTAPDAPPAKPAAPAQNAQPAQGQQAAAPSAAPTAAAAATPPKRGWMGPIAGLAAGLGLAALASHFGFGEALANGLMLALLAGGALLLITFLIRRFGAARSPALAGAGGRGMPLSGQRSEPPLQRSAEPAFTPPPAGLTPTAPAAAAGSPVTRVFVPAAFDSESFARTAKMIFIRLQAAHDKADLDDLKRFTTPEMFASVRLDIQERGSADQHTDVVDVNAEVLDVAQEADQQVVSVRFQGHLVEERGGAPVAFNEVWHLVRPHDESRPWAIAGIEQMA